MLLMLKKHFFLTLCVILWMVANQSYAMKHYQRFWSTDLITGPLSGHDSLRYYLEGNFRFIDEKNKFNQLIFLPGLGYTVNDRVILYSGISWYLTDLPNGRREYESHLWQQINWNINRQISSRTRLEQRKRSGLSSIASRLRQRLWLRIPLKEQDVLFISLFDEIFLNLNYTNWIAPKFFDQNRVFIGLGTAITPNTTLNAGYLNQYLVGRELNNVLSVSLNTTF